MITVRHFAAAAEAAGTDREELDATTVGELRAMLPARTARRWNACSARPRCSRAGAGSPTTTIALSDGTTVDILPPFAGG